jgi:hypothetical protein
MITIRALVAIASLTVLGAAYGEGRETTPTAVPSVKTEDAGQASGQPQAATVICPSASHAGHPCSIWPQDLKCRVNTTHGSHLYSQLC